MRQLLAILVCLLLAVPLPAAPDIYFSNAGTGTQAGTSCANAFNWQDVTNGINHAVNWVAGNILHLCDPITVTAGTTAITVAASGSVGTPITIKFETGASLQSTAMTTGILMNARSNITVDGGTNGFIGNTLNGTSGGACPGGACTTQTSTTGIGWTNGVTNLEVKNLTIQNLYIHTPSTSDVGGAQGISGSGQAVNVNIHDNTIHDTKHNIIVLFDGSSSGVQIHNNHVYNTVWAIFVGDDNANTNMTNVNVYANDIHDFANWFDTGFLNHYDGILFQSTNGSTGTFTNSNIYNNYFHGSMDANGTGYVYLTDSNGGMSGINIFNNLCANVTLANSGSPEACFVLGFGPKNVNIWNNTLAGITQTTPQDLLRIRDTGATGIVSQNNIFASGGSAVHLYSGNTVSSSDFNDYGLPGAFHNTPTNWYFEFPDGTKIGTFAGWISATSLDTPDSISANPNLDSNFIPLAGSPAFNLGTNLFSTCNGQPVPGLGALCFDKPLIVGVGSATVGPNARPASGNWTAGAFQNGATPGCTLGGNVKISGVTIQ